MKSALASTLRGITARIERSFSDEGYAGRPGLLQKLNPRSKLLTILALILVVNLTHRPVLLLAVYLGTLALAITSGIPAWLFISRIWLGIPLVTAVFAIPALFLTPGAPLLVLPLGLVVTHTGATSLVLLLLRVGISVSLGLLLILTTRWAHLLRGLTRLHIPDVVVLVLAMTYRYIHVLLHLTGDMLLSRCSRTVGRLTPRQERTVEGAAVGSLLLHSLDVSSEVYLAMKSRGFRGYAHVLGPDRLKPIDYLWAVCAALLCAGILILSV